MGVLAHRRRRDRGQPVLDVPERAVPHMGDLAHEPAPVPVHALGELAEHGDDRVVADVDLAERRGGVRGDVRRPPEHREGEPPLRLLLVVELVAELRVAVLDVARGMACAHEPVPERDVAKPERLEEVRVLAGAHPGRLPDSAARIMTNPLLPWQRSPPGTARCAEPRCGRRRARARGRGREGRLAAVDSSTSGFPRFESKDTWSPANTGPAGATPIHTAGMQRFGSWIPARRATMRGTEGAEGVMIESRNMAN